MGGLGEGKVLGCAETGRFLVEVEERKALLVVGFGQLASGVALALVYEDEFGGLAAAGPKGV